MKKITLVLSFFTLTLISKAEKEPPIFKKLKTTSGSVICFSHLKEAFFNIKELPSNFYNQSQQIIKTSKGLFLCQPGSGRIYELKSDADTVNLIRIDKTYFSGYNFHSLFFNIDTTIFSYGGYGFWHLNGDLRVYMPHIGEWENLPTNKYIPRSFEIDKLNNFFFIDTAHHSLYIEGPENNEKFNTNEFIDLNKLAGKLFKLSIKTGEWQELGALNGNWLRYRAITSKGILAEADNGFYILDPTNNKKYSFKGQTNEKLMHTPTSTDFQDIRLSYCIGDTLFVGDMDNWIDSIYLDPKDIIDTNQPLYLKNTSIATKTIIAITACIILAILLFIFFKKKKISNLINTTHEKPINLQSSLQPDLLDEREKELLAFVLKQSKNGKLTSILEINDLLGINKRSLDVQKRIRTDTIGPINNKCAYLTNNQEPILSRSRSELDKRMFEYFIKPNRFAEAENILGES